jgi:hypothetical protein
MRRLLAFAFSFASLLPTVASAEGDYNFIQLQVAIGDASPNVGSSYDAVGAALTGSVGVADNFFLQFDSDAIVIDDGSNLMVSGLGGAAGVRIALTEDLDGYVHVGLRKSVIEDDFFEYADDGGAEFGAGLVFAASDAVQLNARYSRADLGDVGTRSVMGAGLVLMVNESFGLVLEYSRQSYSDFALLPGLEIDLTTVGGGLRLTF